MDAQGPAGYSHVAQAAQSKPATHVQKETLLRLRSLLSMQVGVMYMRARAKEQDFNAVALRRQIDDVMIAAAAAKEPTAFAHARSAASLNSGVNGGVNGASGGNLSGSGTGNGNGNFSGSGPPSVFGSHLAPSGSVGSGGVGSGSGEEKHKSDVDKQKQKASESEQNDEDKSKSNGKNK
jgi:hypothetical protein